MKKIWKRAKNLFFKKKIEVGDIVFFKHFGRIKYVLVQEIKGKKAKVYYFLETAASVTNWLPLRKLTVAESFTL